MKFKSAKHKTVFYHALKRIKNDSENVAALYILTSDLKLWNQIRQHISEGEINIAEVTLKESDEKSYALFYFAKDILYATHYLPFADLVDRNVIPKYVFKIIMNAINVARYGIVNRQE